MDEDFILMQIALGPIFGPASGGFLSGVIAATYSHGVKKNHPTNSAKDIVTPLMGTSWDVLFVGGLTAVVSFYFAMLLSKIPYIQLGDTGAISIVILYAPITAIIVHKMNAHNAPMLAPNIPPQKA